MTGRAAPRRITKERKKVAALLARLKKVKMKMPDNPLTRIAQRIIDK